MAGFYATKSLGAPLMQRACWFLRGVGHSLCDGPTGKTALPPNAPAVTQRRCYAAA